MEMNMVCAGKEYFKNVQKFTYNRSKFLRGLGYEVDNGTRRQIADDYKILIQDVVRYLNTVFPAGFSEQEKTYNMSYEDMLKSVMEETATFLRVPRLDSTFKPLGDDSDAILCFKNGVVDKAYNMETIEGLPHKYKTPFFNDLAVGLSIYDIRTLLAKLEVLPNGSIIDSFIAEQEMRVNERLDFLNAVIIRLILNGTKEDLIRAHLFNHYMRVDFDFEQFQIENQEKRTK